ncbi:hypothetical protein U27_03650 [Candidatus Vecturithrix granuli]|uniref:Uncharacterized protein n=1 Tax=Vecturithrix granuli TaxID=1499967 RepID=A0A081BWI2_VECG1|nr:hypothetical protein U27_03650 [Candidatus Vecturithrix granuli]
MVSPEEMFPKVNSDDFYEFSLDGLRVFIQKSFVDTQADIEFLIPYFGKEKIFIQR